MYNYSHHHEVQLLYSCTLQWCNHSGAQWGPVGHWPHHQPLWPHHQQINLSCDPIPLQTVLCIDTLNFN